MSVFVYPAFPWIVLGCILLLAVAGYVIARGKAIALAGEDLSRLHSRPGYHGLYVFLWITFVGTGVYLLMNALGNEWLTLRLMEMIPAGAEMGEMARDQVLLDARKIASGAGAFVKDASELSVRAGAELKLLTASKNMFAAAMGILAALLAFFRTLRKVSLPFRSRNKSERIIVGILLICAALAILTTFGILASLIEETVRFFSHIPIDKFLFGLHWNPLSGLHAGEMDPQKVGAVPLFLGTLLITTIAMLVAVPVGMMAAIYLSDYASGTTRGWAKPLLEILAGIPTVVYGFFAAITFAPFIRQNSSVIVPLLIVLAMIGLVFLLYLLLVRLMPEAASRLMGLLGPATPPLWLLLIAVCTLGVLYLVNPGFTYTVASESALAAGVVMGIMIIPFISSLSDDVINAVPQSLRDGSYGLGATQAETMQNVILPAALPGIVSAILLGISRAVGETMIVVMAAGQSANLTINPLEAVTTVTVQIVMLITGDTEATVAAGPAFSLGFTLFFLTLAFNMAAQRIVRKYREKYD